MSISVVIPVFNGDEYLEETLRAVLAQEVDEPVDVVAIDFRSTDRSLSILHDAEVGLLEFDGIEFGRGRALNTAIREASGDLIAILAQDAIPTSPQWLAAYREAFALDPKVGVAFGPQLPRPDANPILARMQLELFAGLSDSGVPIVQSGDKAGYLSSANSCILREAWEQIPFRDIPSGEDHAMGRDLLMAGWKGVFHPEASVSHSNRDGMGNSLGHRLTEYRDLGERFGRVGGNGAGRARQIGRSIRSDAAYLRGHKFSPMQQIKWIARSAVEHTGSAINEAIDDRLPSLARMVLPPRRGPNAFTAPDAAALAVDPLDDVRRYWVEGAAPLVDVSADDAGRDAIEIAWIVPPFGIGSGGHTTIFRMVQELERRGHSCSIWVHDTKQTERHSGASIRQRINDHFMSLNAPVHLGFDDWTGTDVVVATGWQTVFPALQLPNCRARAYFVQDHEPEFYPTSAASVFAEQTYRVGLHCITASPWLAEVVRNKYGAEATPFELGVNPDEYHPIDMPRRNDTVCFYARNVTPRRAVKLGLLALSEVMRRRPNTRVVLFGTPYELPTSFPHEHLGVVPPDRLNRLYNEATVGLSLSLTNYSLIPQEMMGAGLPVVELAGRACESVFGKDGDVVRLAQDNPASIADAICDLLENRELRQSQADRAQELVAGKTWLSAADIVERALIETIRSRGRGVAPVTTPSPSDSIDSRAGTLI